MKRGAGARSGVAGRNGGDQRLAERLVVPAASCWCWGERFWRSFPRRGRCFRRRWCSSSSSSAVVLVRLQHVLARLSPASAFDLAALRGAGARDDGGGGGGRARARAGAAVAVGLRARRDRVSARRGRGGGGDARLGIDRGILTVLEGEGLVNDATALIAYRMSVAAVVAGLFRCGRRRWSSHGRRLQALASVSAWEC